jgi:hypothetical protein
VHDAVAGRDDVDVLERGFGPVDEMETILVAAILDRAVLVEGIGLEAGVASRNPARSTSAVWPRISWHTTRAGNHGKSSSRLRSMICRSESSSRSGSQRRTRFSASTRDV